MSEVFGQAAIDQFHQKGYLHYQGLISWNRLIYLEETASLYDNEVLASITLFVLLESDVLMRTVSGLLQVPIKTPLVSEVEKLNAAADFKEKTSTHKRGDIFLWMPLRTIGQSSGRSITPGHILIFKPERLEDVHEIFEDDINNSNLGILASFNNPFPL